ncbi:MAG: glycosyltransferase [Micromonosporaceae bacterium]
MSSKVTLPDRRAVDHCTSVVIATRNRPDSLDRTLHALSTLQPLPRIIVVDNGSDGGVGRLREHPARPRVIALHRNRAAAARTIGARLADTPYVAFSDDDSWWDPQALSRAADAFDRHPRLGLVAGRVLVGPRHEPDPVTEAMAASPVPGPVDLPGRPVLGCLACATVVRRDAFLAVGGFRELFRIGGEETLLCYDLTAAGWGVRYLDDVVAHHHPAPERPPSWRRRALERRNAALVRWMRRPLRVAVADSWRLVRDAGRDRVARAALVGLAQTLPVALAERRRLPAHVEEAVRVLERAEAAGWDGAGA